MKMDRLQLIMIIALNWWQNQKETPRERNQKETQKERTKLTSANHAKETRKGRDPY